MRKYIILASLTLITFMSSCELDKLPGDSIATEEAFQTIEDVQAFRTGSYALYRLANRNSIRVLSDYQSDIINAVADYGNNQGMFYLWQPGLATDYDIQEFYEYNYLAINNVNNIINNIDLIEIADESEAKLIEKYKGEAHLMRASLFHNLVRYFAKDYNPSTADSDLGIALPMEYDPNAKPARASLKATYDQIQSDLNQAKALLPDDSTPMADYLTKDFAHAIQARVSLEREEFEEAINASDKIIPNYALASTEEQLKDLWTNDNSSEILVALYTSLQEGSFKGPSYINYNFSTRKHEPLFVPSRKATEAYEDDDLRKKVYFINQDITVAGSNYENVILINKYPGNPEFDSNSRFSDYVNKPKLFMISEAYLIKAEAQARGQIGDAIATLNELRTARGATSLSSGDAFELVKEERFREMLAEGQRLLDLKRWGEDLNRTGGQDVMQGGLFTGGSDAPNLSKPASDKMWVWEIPLNDLNTNENMKPNW